MICIDHLYAARTQALKILNIAIAIYEKNYNGEKGEDVYINLLDAVKKYEEAENEFTKAIQGALPTHPSNMVVQTK